MAEVVEVLYDHEVDGRVAIDATSSRPRIDAYYEQYGVK